MPRFCWDLSWRASSVSTGAPRGPRGAALMRSDSVEEMRVAARATVEASPPSHSSSLADSAGASGDPSSDPT